LRPSSHQSRPPTFNALPSRRAVPVIPVMRGGVLVELLPTACCLRQVDRGSAITSDLTSLRLGFTAHSARRFTASVCTGGMLVPLLPGASRCHAGNRVTCLLDCFQDRLLSFHGEKRRFPGAHQPWCGLSAWCGLSPASGRPVLLPCMLLRNFSQHRWSAAVQIGLRIG